MSRNVRNVIPQSSRYAQMQKRKQNISASDYFRSPGEAAPKARVNCEEAIRNASIKNQYGIQTHSTTYRNFANDFTRLVADDNDEILSMRLVDPTTKVAEVFDKTLNNRIQRFNYKNSLYDYKEVLGVESISGEGYYNLKQQGYNNFYNLYVKLNEYTQDQQKVLCVLAFKK